MPSFLLVRADDPVVVGVSCTNCAISDGTLVATGPGATITFSFPPQALAETKVDGASIQGAVLAGGGTISFELPADVAVPLAPDRLLQAVASLAVAPAATALELPFGLVMSPGERSGA